MAFEKGVKGELTDNRPTHLIFLRRVDDSDGLERGERRDERGERREERGEREREIIIIIAETH